jgi:oligopeptide transport system substrate-binding protein
MKTALIIRGLSLLLLMTLCASPAITAPRADLVLINGSEPDSIDPALIRGQPEGRIAYALFEGLARYDAQGRAIPGMAERWEVSPDGLRYTFHLREGIRWSNGDPVTSADFVAGWRRALEPETGCEYSYQLYYVRGAKEYSDGKTKDFSTVGLFTPNPRTLVVELHSPTPFFPELCAFMTLMPVHMPTVEAARKELRSWTRPGSIVTNGAFLLEEHRMYHRIRLKKNPAYWDAANVRLDTVDVLPAPSPMTAMNYYLTGLADLLLDKSLTPTSLIPVLKLRPDYHAFPSFSTYFVRYNVTRKPFTDVRVRKAFSLVMDRELFTQKVTQAGEPPTTKYVPPGVPGYESPKGLERDVETAKRLMAEAGFPNGKGLAPVRYLYTNRSENDERIAVEMQRTLKDALGVEMILTKQEWAVYLNSLSALDYDFCRSSWVGDYPDPNTFLDMFVTGGGQNNTGWSNARYDALIAEAGRETDTKKRFAIFREAERMLVEEEFPICPLFHYVVTMFHSDDILGLEPNVMDEHPIRTIHWRGGRRPASR